MPQSTKGLSSPFPAAVPVQWLWGWHLQVAQAVASVHPAPTGTPRALGTGRNQRPQTHGPVRLSCTLPVSQQPLPCVLSHSQEKGLAGGKSCCSGMAGTEQPLFGFHFLEKQMLGGFTLHGRMPQSTGLGSAEGNESEAGPRLHPSCELRCSPATTAPEHVPWEQHGSGICQSPCNKESRGGKTQMPRTCLHGSGCLGIASVLQNEGKKKKTPECDPGKSSPKKWSRRGGFPSNEAAQGVRAILAGGDTVRVGSPGTAPLQRSV